MSVKVTNVGTCPVALPGRKAIDPGQSNVISEEEFEALEARPVCAAWFKSGMLEASEDDGEAEATDPSVPVGNQEDDAPEETEAEEKARLIEALAEYGIEKTTRTSVEKLREALAEAEGE